MSKTSTNMALFLYKTDYPINELADGSKTVNIGEYPVSVNLFIDSKETAEGLHSALEEVINYFKIKELGA
jgi:hypothetical protein